MLRREGFMINHKRTERLYREEGLALRIRRRKKMASLLRTEIPKPDYAHHIWSMDFMRDNLSDGAFGLKLIRRLMAFVYQGCSVR